MSKTHILFGSHKPLSGAGMPYRYMVISGPKDDLVKLAAELNEKAREAENSGQWEWQTSIGTQYWFIYPNFHRYPGYYIDSISTLGESNVEGD